MLNAFLNFDSFVGFVKKSKMAHMQYPGNWILRTLLLLGVLFPFSSCNNDDDDGDTIAEVVVVTQQGARVPGATVTLECESTISRPCELKVVGLTDAGGVFRYQTNLPKVLRIEAFKLATDTQILGTLPDTVQVITVDSICGESFISIQENETSRQTVVLNDC